MNIPSHRTIAASACTAAVVLALAACGGPADADSPAGDGPCPDTLRFSDTGVEGLETLVLEFEGFRAALEEAIGTSVEFYPISSRTAAATALEFGEIDLLLTGPAEYVVLQQEAEAIPVTGVTRENYRAAIFVRAGSDVTAVSDLQGRQIITKEVGSTSGHLGILEMLVSSGLEPGVNVEVVALSDIQIETFASGEGDALGTGISDFDDIAEIMGEGNVEILQEGPDLPNDLFVARAELGQECADWLQGQLVENQDVLLEAITQTGENDKYLNSEFVPAHDSDYNPTRVAFEAAGFDRYADLPDEDEADGGS